ncbi:extensin [Nostoc sp. 3335mG]|nr:extensin [Nostoc sp. 3335mG]
MRALSAGIRTLVWFVIVALIGFAIYAFARSRPQDVPWTPLDLSQPVGMFTRAKIGDLRGDFAGCQALLDAAGVRYTALPAREVSAQCGYDDAVRMLGGGSRTIAIRPDVGVTCRVATGMALWEWQVVQPAAQKHFGTPVTRIDNFGSYNCRRMYGRDSGAFSEHATANALDIAAFLLADGRRVSVVGDWTAGQGQDAAAKAAFLRDVRDGACDIFSTVLSPDYNAAHRDHFHFDQAVRGFGGACR